MYEITISEKSKLNAVYSTPNRVVFKGPITLDERTFNWLMNVVHIYDVKEILWERQ